MAALGVGLVAYGFVRLAGEFSHAGSVYAFVGNTLGPRPGFLAGWALLGTYLVFPPVSIMGVAIFGRAFLSTTGLAADADWYPLALTAWFVLYHNVWPVPPAPYEYFPYLVVGWLVAGLIVTAVIPGFAMKVDDGLERAAGIK